MRVANWGLAAWATLVLAGCNCDPKGEPDASTPVTLEWPASARLEITATTTSTASLKWPDVLGPLATYRLTMAAATQDEAGTTATLTGLTPGQHVHVEVVAVATDGTTTPPLRAEVAPTTVLQVPDGDISADFCGANAFLSQGSAVIPCDVFSVLVGHVYTKDGVGVPGMRISALGHPEWGSATSQTGGLYALAVAAGRHTLELRASAFIPIQRLATAKARDFSYLPDTAVLRRDEKATAISTAAGGFHTATPQQDEDGQRTTSVFIPAGTSAWLRLTDGGTQPTSTLTLRATEATVGPSGPEAMPASLPGATAYTFAADLSADEAIAAGARGVGFTSPEGRVTKYLTESRGGQRVLTTARPDGTVSTRVYGAGVERHFSADGTSTSVLMQPGAGNRFGRAVDVAGTVVVKTPSGLESTATSLRTSTHAPGDVFGVTEEVEETRLNGRLWRSRYDGITKTFEVTSPEGRTASATLNAKLRPLTVTEPGELPVTFGYDDRGRIASVMQGARSEILTYDSNGFLNTARNGLGEVTSFAVDTTGRLEKTTRADAKEVVVEYEPAGNLTSITPPDAGIAAQGALVP